jgi:hypothetical protein
MGTQTIDLNDKMLDELKKMYWGACYQEWLYAPEHHGSWIDGRTGQALVRRGLCAEKQINSGFPISYVLTDDGFNYCRDVLQLTKPYSLNSHDPDDLMAQRQLEHWLQSDPNFNPQAYVSLWQITATRAHEKAVDWSKHGGEMLDRDLLRKADRYRALVNIVSSWSVN